MVKILITLLVPISLIILGAAFWKRNLLVELSVSVLIAVGKVTWSMMLGGEPGTSLIALASLGLIIEWL